MDVKSIKKLIKKSKKQCYLRIKNKNIEVIEEIVIDYASNSIQGKIIGCCNTDRVGLEINVAMENIEKLPYKKNKS